MPDTTLYYYTPSLPAAILFIVLFSVVTLYLIFQAFRYRAKFTIPLIIGGIFEIIAYAARLVSHFDSQSLGPYIVTALLALVAPALFAATIYMILTRLIRVLNASHLSPINPKLLTPIFVLGDILSFQIQSTGAGLQAKPDSSSENAGRIIVIGALILQMIIFCFFLYVTFKFHRRINASPTPRAQTMDWRGHLVTLYSTSMLILIRNLARTVEYAEGSGGWIFRHEWFIYVFDSAMMFGVMLGLAVIYTPKLMREGREKDALESSETAGTNLHTVEMRA